MAVVDVEPAPLEGGVADIEVRYDLPQMVRASGVNKEVMLRPQEMPGAMIQSLVKTIMIIPNEWEKQVRERILPAYAEMVPETVVTDGTRLTLDALHDPGKEAFRLSRGATRRQYRRVYKDVEAWLRRADKWHLNGWQQTVKAGTGIDVFPYIDLESSKEHIEAMQARIAGLVRSLDDGMYQDLQKTVWDGVLKQTPRRDMAKQLEKRIGVGRSRAELIASDQANKTAAELTMLRQGEAGISMFVWSTAKDDRVRPEHAALHGKVFRWDRPPAIGLPGTPIRCRCTGRAFIPMEAVGVGISRLTRSVLGRRFSISAKTFEKGARGAVGLAILRRYGKKRRAAQAETRAAEERWRAEQAANEARRAAAAAELAEQELTAQRLGVAGVPLLPPPPPPDALELLEIRVAPLPLSPAPALLQPPSMETLLEQTRKQRMLPMVEQQIQKQQTGPDEPLSAQIFPASIVREEPFDGTVYRAGPVEDRRYIYFAIERDLAEAYGEDLVQEGFDADIGTYRVQLRHPLVLDTPERVYAAWQQSGALGIRPGYPDQMHAFNDWARSLGYDGIVVPKSAFKGELGHQWAGGTFGEPQIVAFDLRQVERLGKEDLFVGPVAPTVAGEQTAVIQRALAEPPYTGRISAKSGKDAIPNNGAEALSPKQFLKLKNELQSAGVVDSNGNLVAYHVTTSDIIALIKERGLVPGASRPAGQEWKPVHSRYATYFHLSSDAVRNDLDNLLGMGLDLEDYSVVTVRIPFTKSNAARILPDEDVSLDPKDWQQALRGRSSVAIVEGASPLEVRSVTSGGKWKEEKLAKQLTSEEIAAKLSKGAPDEYLAPPIRSVTTPEPGLGVMIPERPLAPSPIAALQARVSQFFTPTEVQGREFWRDVITYIDLHGDKGAIDYLNQLTGLKLKSVVDMEAWNWDALVRYLRTTDIGTSSIDEAVREWAQTGRFYGQQIRQDEPVPVVRAAPVSATQAARRRQFEELLADTPPAQVRNFTMEIRPDSRGAQLIEQVTGQRWINFRNEIFGADDLRRMVALLERSGSAMGDVMAGHLRDAFRNYRRYGRLDVERIEPPPHDLRTRNNFLRAVVNDDRASSDFEKFTGVLLEEVFENIDDVNWDGVIEAIAEQAGTDDIDDIIDGLRDAWHEWQRTGVLFGRTTGPFEDMFGRAVPFTGRTVTLTPVGEIPTAAIVEETIEDVPANLPLNFLRAVTESSEDMRILERMTGISGETLYTFIHKAEDIGYLDLHEVHELVVGVTGESGWDWLSRRLNEYRDRGLVLGREPAVPFIPAAAIVEEGVITPIEFLRRLISSRGRETAIERLGKEAVAMIEQAETSINMLSVKRAVVSARGQETWNRLNQIYTYTRTQMRKRAEKEEVDRIVATPTIEPIATAPVSQLPAVPPPAGRDTLTEFIRAIGFNARANVRFARLTGLRAAQLGEVSMESLARYVGRERGADDWQALLNEFDEWRRSGRAFGQNLQLGPDVTLRPEAVTTLPEMADEITKLASKFYVSDRVGQKQLAEKMARMLLPHLEDKGWELRDAQFERYGYSQAVGFSMRWKHPDYYEDIATSRRFALDERKTVDHSYFKIPDDLQGVGDISRTMIGNLEKMYEQWGIKLITVHANIDIGGYAWARTGFVPDDYNWRNLKRDYLRPRWERFLRTEQADRLRANSNIAPMFQAIEDILNSDDPDAIFRLIDLDFPYEDPDDAMRSDDDKNKGKKNTIGKYFLINSDWNGAIDRTDPVQLQRFHDYLAGKKQKPI